MAPTDVTSLGANLALVVGAGPVRMGGLHYA
jgi:hypothetical protein